MPRDNESLIDIERAVKRILRYTNNISRTELEMNDEKVSAILYQIAVIYLRNFVSNIPKYLGEI